MNKILLILLLSCLTSCAMYQQEFDSPPPCGVPCTSVTDLESMIVETDKGADLFLPNQQSAVNRICEVFSHKVWVADDCFQGHYIYKNQKRQ